MARNANEVFSYEEAVRAKIAEPRVAVIALCPVCNAEQSCFVDMPGSSENPEVACMECMTTIFSGKK